MAKIKINVGGTMKNAVYTQTCSDCTNQCTNECKGCYGCGSSCYNSCKFACGECDGNCYACAGKCQGSCNTACMTTCTGGCKPGCTSCKNECINTCANICADGCSATAASVACSNCRSGCWTNCGDEESRVHSVHFYGAVGGSKYDGDSSPMSTPNRTPTGDPKDTKGEVSKNGFKVFTANKWKTPSKIKSKEGGSWKTLSN